MLYYDTIIIGAGQNGFICATMNIQEWRGEIREEAGLEIE